MSITYKDPNNTVGTGGVDPTNELWFYSSALFDRTYEDALWFDSKLSQYTWFADTTNMLFSIDSVKYAIKNEFSIDFRVPYNTEKFLGCGYICRVKDRNITGKTERRWYYFIDSIEAYSPNSSVLHCTLDVIQTFMFDWQLKEQQVERMLEPVGMTYLNDLMLTNEVDMPVIERCESYSKKSPTVTMTSIATGDAIGSRSGILVVTVQKPEFVTPKQVNSVSPYGLYDTKWHRAELCENTDGTFIDGSALYYFYFNNLAKAKAFLNVYTMKTTDLLTDSTALSSQSHMNAIKGIYGVPLICAGQYISTFSIPETTISTSINYQVGYCVRPYACAVNTTITLPESLYSYTPHSKKALSSVCLSIETRGGRSMILSLKDCDIKSTGTPATYYIDLSIVGICSINPTIMVFPHKMDNPMSLMSENSNFKSSNFIKYSLSPSFAIYDQQGEEIYNASYEASKSQAQLSMINSAIGMLTNPLSAPSQIVSMLNTSISLNQLQETYNTPKNLIGDAEPDELWATNFSYLLIRVLAPCKNNFIGFDNDLSITGISYGGKIVNLSYSSGNVGVTLNGRNYFNYIKTVRCKLGGNLGIYKSKIESIFDNGIRFWNIANSTVKANGIGAYPNAILNGN